MNPHEYGSLGALEDAQSEERRAARLRIDRAEDYLAHFWSRATWMQESLHEVAAREGVLDSPDFRAEFNRVRDDVEENLRGAVAVVTGPEEEYEATLTRHSDEIAAFTDSRKSDDAAE